MKNSEKRSNQLSRMFEILGMINRGKQCTRSGLSEYFEVSERTISRDLSLMSKLFPVYYDTETGTYSFAGDYSFKDVNLSPEEVRALMMCRLIASNLGEPISGPIDSLMKKLKVEMGKKSSKMLEKASANYSFEIAPTERVTALQKWFNVIQHALDESLSLEITHRQEALRQVETIDPYGFFTRAGRFNLIAYSHEKRELGVFAIHRIRNIRLTEKSYARPSTFSIRDFLENRKEIVYAEDIEKLNWAIDWLDTTIGLYVSRKGTWILSIFALNYGTIIKDLHKLINSSIEEIKENGGWPNDQMPNVESIVLKTIEKELNNKETTKRIFENVIKQFPFDKLDESIRTQFNNLKDADISKELKDFLKAHDDISLKGKRNAIKLEIERLKAMVAEVVSPMRTK